MQTDYGSRNLPQAGFRNIARRRAEGIDGTTGIEVGDISEILKIKVFFRVDSAAGKKHICHAVLQGGSVFHLDIQLVQFFQKAVLPAIHEFIQIVGKVVVHGVVRRRNEGVGKGGFVRQLAEGVFQALNDLCFIP
ncbi:hypothetical protein [Caproiciproducens sp. CPB-2]|uniref:hypothetical protein n=1 Tax=Caproiciproducens sp. CPB-2 TaxID=3030017 RepID=UPI0023DB3BAC|nr:hypothetical protein [Caproiciproducens sp. CPB-2]MDF1494570.1 hypothetical protein [Caproiciproducens sp. CPB-2]